MMESVTREPVITSEVAARAPEQGGGVPPWVAGSVAVIFLLAVGTLIYWFVGGPFPGTTTFIPDPDHAREQVQRRGPFRQNNADGVQPSPDNRGYVLRVGAARMEVDFPGGDKKRAPNFGYRIDSQTLLTPEQWHLALGIRRTADPQWAKTLAITPAQADRLRRLGGIGLDLSKADRDQLAAAWTQYDQAKDKTAPEKKLIALLKDATARALPATKAKAADRIAEFTRILTPDQVRELTKLGAGETVTPIQPGATPARPATAPSR